MGTPKTAHLPIPDGGSQKSAQWGRQHASCTRLGRWGGRQQAHGKDADWRRSISTCSGLPPHTPPQEPCAAMELLMGPFYRQEDQGPADQPASAEPWTGCLGCQRRPACRLASPGVSTWLVASPCPHAAASPSSLLPPGGLRMNRAEARRPLQHWPPCPRAGTAWSSPGERGSGEQPAPLWPQFPQMQSVSLRIPVVSSACAIHMLTPLVLTWPLDFSSPGVLPAPGPRNSESVSLSFCLPRDLEQILQLPPCRRTGVVLKPH